MRAALAPFAILVLAYLPGRALIRAGPRSNESVLGRLWPFPDLLAGVCVMAWSAFALAECGRFSLVRLGVALLAVGGAARLFARRRPAQRLTTALGAGLGLAAVIGALYLPPFDTSVMASDATYHYNVGVHLARSGGLAVPDPVLAELDTPSRALLLPEWSGGRIRLAGGLFLSSLDADTAWPTYSHLLAVWIAIFETIGGPGAGGLAGITFAILGAWAVCLLVAETQAWTTAVVAALLLVTTQAQIFYSRFAMPEIVGQALLWGGILAFVLWWRDDDRTAGVLAAASLALSGFARLELLAVVPVVLVLHFAFAAEHPRSRAVFLVVYLALAAHAVVHLVVVPSHYRAVLAGELAAASWLPAGSLTLAALAGTGAGLLAFAVAGRRPHLARRLARPAALAVAATVALVHVRSSRFAAPIALRWLLEGVPWPILAAAAVGLGSWGREPGARALRFPLLLFVAATAALVYDPHVTRVQLWGIRRFLPVTIPFVCLVAAIVVMRAARSVAPARPRAAAVVLAVLLLVLNLRGARIVLGDELFPSQAPALRALASDIPARGVVFVAPELADFVIQAPLWLAHGRETFVLSLWNWPGELRRAAPQLLARRPVFYLTRRDGPAPVVPPLALALRRELDLRFVVPEPHPRRAPSSARVWHVPLALYEVTAPAVTLELRRPPLRHEVAVGRGREIDDQRHVHAQRVGSGAEEPRDRPHAFLAFDEDDGIRHAVLPRGQHGRVHDDPREEARATARPRPFVLERPAARAHRPGRMPPRRTVAAALEPQLAPTCRRPVRDPVGTAGAAFELVRHVSPPRGAARRSGPCFRS